MADLSPTPPLFVIEGHDMSIYGSVEDSQNDLEPPDIAEGIYKAYDARGRRLQIETNGRDTYISLAETVASSAAELEAELRSFLRQLDEPLATEEGCDLPCLVEIAKNHVHQPIKLRDVIGSIGRLFRRHD